MLSGGIPASMRTAAMNNSSFHQRGVALILVLWATMLLTVIAGSFAYATRTDMSVLGNAVLRARAEAAADAGVHRAVLETLKPLTDAERWKTDGRPHDITLGEAAIRVSLQDESAKIDINSASPVLLRGLFLSVGLDDQGATRLVEAIQDWRDPDLLTLPNGAEESAYVEAGLKQKPPNAPFQTIEELRLVLGMTAGLYRRIEPMITIYSRQPGINFAIASRDVLMVIPGVTAEQVDAFIAVRDAAAAANQPPPPFPQGAAYGAVPAQLALQIRSEATLDGVSFERLAVIRTASDPKRPFAALSWREQFKEAARPTDGAAAGEVINGR